MKYLINGVYEITQLISKAKEKTMSKYNNKKVSVGTRFGRLVVLEDTGKETIHKEKYFFVSVIAERKLKWILLDLGQVTINRVGVYGWRR